jgi:hypothetical protein
MAERLLTGGFRLLVPALTLPSAGAMTSCGEPDCGRDHPDDIALEALCSLKSVEVPPFTKAQAFAAGRLYRRQTAARYVGDTVLAACGSFSVADQERMPLITTRRARYCYASLDLDAITRKIEI